MSTVKLIIGLPGSGKTTWAENNCPGFTIFNDPGILCDPLDIEKALAADKDVAITDPYFCYANVLEKCESFVRQCSSSDVIIEKIYFTNEPKVCLVNATSRPKKAVSEFIRQLSKVYTPPSDAIPCWRNE